MSVTLTPQDALGYELSLSQLQDLVFINGCAKAINNERLELIGDSTLALAVSATLSYKNPWLQEGELTKIRSHTVSKTMLYRIAKQTGIIRGQVRRRKSAKPVSDLVEALLGSVFIGCGFNTSYFIVRNLFPKRFNSSDLLTHNDTRILTKESLGSINTPNQRYHHLEKYWGFCLVKWLLRCKGCCLVGVGYGKRSRSAGRKATRKLLGLAILGCAANQMRA